jgi:hypothetical protein
VSVLGPGLQFGQVGDDFWVLVQPGVPPLLRALGFPQGVCSPQAILPVPRVGGHICVVISGVSEAIYNAEELSAGAGEVVDQPSAAGYLGAQPDDVTSPIRAGRGVNVLASLGQCLFERHRLRGDGRIPGCWCSGCGLSGGDGTLVIVNTRISGVCPWP